jgi:hypothetical protein
LLRFATATGVYKNSYLHWFGQEAVCSSASCSLHLA